MKYFQLLLKGVRVEGSIRTCIWCVTDIGYIGRKVVESKGKGVESSGFTRYSTSSEVSSKGRSFDELSEDLRILYMYSLNLMV